MTIFRACMEWLLRSVASATLYGFLLYIVVPILFKIYPRIVLEGLFLNRVCPPRWFIQLGNPEKKYKLKKSKSCRVKSTSGSTLGVWHIPPMSKYDTPNVDSTSLGNAESVIVYCHGNAFHRGFKHRRDLYENLQRAGYHVVTFDYSGYGDSTGHPTPTNVVEDALSVYKWTIEQVKEDATVVLWGHSLGTFISTRTLSRISEGDTRPPEVLVLEAPFTNAIEAADTFPLSKIFYSLYPFLRNDVQRAVHQLGAECETEKYLPQVKTPILILHAEDDHRIPLRLGEKLYRKTTSDPETRSRFIRFIRMHGRHEVKHYTANHPEICQIFQGFVDEVLSSKLKGHEPGNKERFELIDV